MFDQNPALRRPIHLMMDDELVRCFREAGLEVVRAPTGDFAAYLAFIGGIDLGLAHLMDSDFAQGRSDGKYLEYAARGVVALCKNGGTFRHTIRHGDNGFLYENAQDLAAILQGLADRPERLAEVRAGALADLREVRNHTVAAQERLAWYREFSPELGTEGARFHLAEDPIEERFFQLMTAHSEDPETYADALSRGYLGLTETHPDFYRPWSLLGDLVRRQGGGQRADLLQKFATRIMQKSFNRAWGTVSVAELISSP